MAIKYKNVTISKNIPHNCGLNSVYLSHITIGCYCKQYKSWAPPLPNARMSDFGFVCNF